MKFARFIDSQNQISSGVLTTEGIQEIQGSIFDDWNYTGKIFSPDHIQLLAPLQPNQIIGIGANYVTHVDDLPETTPEIPVFFFKPTSSVIGPEANIVIPNSLDKVKFESELAVVIGKKARNINESEILDYVFGYTIGNDVTAPQYFHPNGHWTLGKSFDTFTPLGPVIETDITIEDVRVEAYHNQVKKQDSFTELMIVTVRSMISYLTQVMTLQPGDVILTGSPVGAEFLHDGDAIACKIGGIGTLRNTVIQNR